MCGEPLLLKTAYEAGLGSKNSQGFGCFEILDERSKMVK
ncbi:MAG: CRISPR-associated endoribonuclease Cas6 [Thermovenabulum sp.]